MYLQIWVLKWAALWQNQQNTCAQRRLRSALAFTQSDKMLRSICIERVTKDPSFLRVDSEDWSDWAEALADLSLPWANTPFCWFCHDVAQIMLVVFKKATLAQTFKIYIYLHVLSILIPAASPSVCSLQSACEYKVWAESFTHWCHAQVDKFQLLTKIKAFEINFNNHYNIIPSTHID